MLVKDLGRKLGAGIDLTNYEVKSARRGGSYEYQYHRNTGREKLLRDMEVGHLYFDYHDNLKEVDLRYLHGAALAVFFGNGWKTIPIVIRRDIVRTSLTAS